MARLAGPYGCTRGRRGGRLIVVCTGPESSGKTTLAQALAAHLKVPLVREQARDYLSTPRYVPTDILNIAARQVAAERDARVQASLACADTDLQVLYIWWQERFGPAPSALARAYATQSPRLYLLCRPDLPWQADPLRENPNDRDRLFELYRRDLSARELNFAIVEGQGQARVEQALGSVAGVV